MSFNDIEPQSFDTIEQSNAEGDLHLWDYVWVIFRHWPMAVIVFLFVVFCGTVYSLTRTSMYTSTSQILVDTKPINLTDIKGAYDAGLSGITQREYIQTQIKLITSRPVMESAFIKLDLASHPSFQKAKDPIRSLSRIIKASPVRNTQLIEVSATRTDPTEAARIVDAVVSAYIEGSRSRRIGVSTEGLDELRIKAEELRIKVDETAKEVQNFKTAHKIVSFEKAESLILERLRDLNSNLAAAQPKRMKLEARVKSADDAIAKGLSADSLPDILNAPVIKELKLDLARLQQSYSEMLLRLGESHPQLQSITTKIEASQTKLAMEASAILSSTKIEFEQAKQEEELLRAALSAQEEEVARFNRLAVQYNFLQQSYTSVDETFKTIIRRIAEIDLNLIGGQGDNVFVTQKASVPTDRSWPDRKKNFMVAVMLGGLLAIGLCFFVDYMDTSIGSEVDVRHIMKGNVLGHVPAIEGGSSGPEIDFRAIKAPHGQIAEAFRAVRTALSFRTGAEESPKIIVISSVMPSEGKSLTAINLAIAEAQAGKKTLLIDGDMRKPRLHKAFGIPADAEGLADLLENRNDLSTERILELSHRTNIEKLRLLPCGKIPATPAELLDSDSLSDMLALASRNFDMVIVDTPPALGFVDALVAGKRCDGIVLVVRTLSTQKSDARHLAENIRESGIRLLGVVFNDADVKRSMSPHKAYGYGSYGYNSYRGYYHSDEGDKSAAQTRLQKITDSAMKMVSTIRRRM